jgi:release factor-specific protein-(glutamine-N5) methyltransferase
MKKRQCNIGGQAVLEGVMMRSQNSYAVAVRAPDGQIQVESERIKVSENMRRLSKIPVIRGIISFVSSMAMGIRTLNRAAEVYSSEMQDSPSKFEKWAAKKLKIDLMSVLVAVSMVLGVLLALGLFVVLPHLATEGIIRLMPNKPNTIVLNLIAGAIRIIIFICYILIIGRIKDIKRLFMYHGAEHKVVNCFESGLELTVDNAKKMSTKHDRCGTTFLFIIMVFSIIFFSFDVFSNNLWQRVLIRIAFIPLVAGLSYELLKLFAKYDNLFTRIMKYPGLLLQRLTTKEPDDDMLEVAIKAFDTVAELDGDPKKPTQKFMIYQSVEKAVKELADTMLPKNEAEIIYMHVLGAKTRGELYASGQISSTETDKAKKYAKQRLKGAPLQYVLNNACFYGYDFYVDQRALIPRFDTEHLAKAAIDLLKDKKGAEVLDLMTGSGCIAVTVAKNADCRMTATDISAQALEVAKINAQKHECDIEFLNGNLFKPVKNRKFDMIICNPPYIPSSDIPKLDKEVKDYEPLTALDGGADGLDFYRDIALKAADYLKEEGFLLLETGINQAQKVTEMLGENYETEIVYDLNNPPVARVIIARKKREVRE